jgi:hypothetical protein
MPGYAASVSQFALLDAGRVKKFQGDMKVTGFSFIRNGIKYDYPYIEAIQSVLPLCDDFVVAVGNSEDETEEVITKINPGKIRIINTIWDDTLREGGRVLAQETNKAFQAINSDSDWAFYIQGDEVLHEKYHSTVLEAMRRWQEDQRIDGLLFNYLHFYGSYDYIGSAPRWYRREIRIIRTNKKIYSHGDAQGFRKNSNEKLRVKAVDAWIYHYGWVKNPHAMQQKQQSFNRYWHDDRWMEQNILPAESFDYSTIDALKRFTGSHPAVMQQRIKNKNWQFDYELSFNRLSFKSRLKIFTEKYFGFRIGERKNYILL